MASEMDEIFYLDESLVEVDSNCIEVEVTTSDMFLLEPLKDHNYISTSIKPDATKPKKKQSRNIRKHPKITSLTLLYNCKVCGYATTKNNVFLKHMELHTKITPGTKYLPCDNCNVNKGVPKGYFKCPNCSFYAKSESSLRVHMHIHNSETAYKCTECSFFGKDVKELVTHLKTSQRYQCVTCPYSSHVQDKVILHQLKHTAKIKLLKSQSSKR